MQSPLAFSVSLIALMASCAPKAELAVAPSVAAGTWREGATPGSTRISETWTAFGSPELEALIARARVANADIALARARVTQARGQLRVARSESLPTVSASGDAGIFTGSNRRRQLGDDQSLGLDIAYDVDLFGSAKAGRRSGRARLAAAQFETDAAALAVEADVARAYFQHAALSTRIVLLKRGLGNARELDRIIGVRVREGVATRVDSGLQTIEVRRIEAEISRIEEARSRTRNALAVLVGEEAPLFDVKADKLGELTAPRFEPVQPGALLVRRPDIRAAEAQIAAANGDVDRARAAFLPSLRISAGSLLEASPLGLGLSAGAGLLAPIFDGGRLEGDLTTAGGAQRETVERYHRALLVALGEGEDALTGIAQSERRVSLLAQTLDVARTTARLARRQYVEGAADLQTVLDAERSALDLEDAHTVAVQDRLNAAIDLYRALGGGGALNQGSTAAR